MFIGASFISPCELEEAIGSDYVSNVLWGQDYPHAEGTWTYREDGVSMTQLHFRHAFLDASPADTRAILSDNAISVYGLEPVEMQRIAERINAPTLAEISVPLEEVPNAMSGGFRPRVPCL